MQTEALLPIFSKRNFPRTMIGYMLDTNVFSRLKDGKIHLDQLPFEGPFFVTHVQRDELNADSCETSKAGSWSMFETIDPDAMLTESMVLGISRLGLCKLSDDDLYSRLLAALESRSKRRSNPADAVIAETAIKTGLTLLTCDKALHDSVRDLGGSTEFIEAFRHY
jgi:predicted nucleic acid-binding protein